VGEVSGDGDVTFLSPDVVARDSHEKGLLKLRAALAALLEMVEAMDLSGDAEADELEGILKGAGPGPEFLSF
jgi:hypothetical protein